VLATSQPVRQRGTRVIRSSGSDSGPPRCCAWSRAGHPRREASGSGGGRGGICVGESAAKGGSLGRVSIIESLLHLLRVGCAPRPKAHKCRRAGSFGFETITDRRTFSNLVHGSVDGKTVSYLSFSRKSAPVGRIPHDNTTTIFFLFPRPDMAPTPAIGRRPRFHPCRERVRRGFHVDAEHI
jgi:hypothetical protein